ncbi:MAG: hypothetical protein HRT44_10810 [Bdellovibrionales bacterium]|nr:hypothetical protein [Bdellovibrionales bacterium]NQZ19731.1 hypothetical protein [Bdellovibrionales bacterium]
MKSIISVLIIMLASTTYATEICMDVPSGVEFDDIKMNFDGSKTYVNPQLYVEGDYTHVIGTTFSATGFCEVVDMKYVRHESVQEFPAKLYAAVDDKGNYTGLFEDSWRVSTVLCRPNQE